VSEISSYSSISALNRDDDKPIDQKRIFGEKLHQIDAFTKKSVGIVNASIIYNFLTFAEMCHHGQIHDKIKFGV